MHGESFLTQKRWEENGSSFHLMFHVFLMMSFSWVLLHSYFIDTDFLFI